MIVWVVLALVALMVFKLSGQSDDKRKLGIKMIDMFATNVETVLVMLTIFFLISEAFIAGSIHPANELYIDGNGRTIAHLMISLAGMTAIFSIPKTLREFKNAETSKVALTFLLLLFIGVAVGVPIANIHLIGHGLGNSRLLGDTIKEFFYTTENWENYCYFMDYPEKYSVWSSMPYIFKAVVIGNIITTIFFIIESLYSVIYGKGEPAPADDANKGGKSKDDGKKADDKGKKKEDDPKKEEKTEIKKFANRAHERQVGQNQARGRLIEFLMTPEDQKILKDPNNHYYYDVYNKVSEGIFALSHTFTTEIDSSYSSSFNQVIENLAARTLNPTNEDVLKREILEFLELPVAKKKVTVAGMDGAGYKKEQLLSFGVDPKLLE